MEFSVMFIAHGVSNYAINIPAYEVGLSGVKQIRTYLDDANFPLSRINGKINDYCSDKEIVISEQTATKSKLFGTRNTVVVNVQNGFLNSYVSLKPHVSADGYCLKLCADIEKIIKGWGSNGFTINWK